MKDIQNNELDKFNSKNVLSDSPIPPKYEDTPLTNFPAAEDNWKRMSDITATLLPVALQYNTLWDSGKIDEANALLKSYPTLIDTIFNADKWNKLRDAIIAIERYYLNDVTEFIKHVAQSAIGINDNPEEENKTVVTYSALKIDELFAELRNDSNNNTQRIDGIEKIVTVKFIADNWIETPDDIEGFSFTQTVNVNEISEKDTPTLIKYREGITGTDNFKAYNKAYGILSDGKGVTENGAVVWKCFKKPTIDITIALKGIEVN